MINYRARDASATGEEIEKTAQLFHQRMALSHLDTILETGSISHSERRKLEAILAQLQKARLFGEEKTRELNDILDQQCEEINIKTAYESIMSGLGHTLAAIKGPFMSNTLSSTI